MIFDPLNSSHSPCVAGVGFAGHCPSGGVVVSQSSARADDTSAAPNRQGVIAQHVFVRLIFFSPCGPFGRQEHQPQAPHRADRRNRPVFLPISLFPLARRGKIPKLEAIDLQAVSKACQNESNVERVHRPVGVLVRGVALGITRPHGTSEPRHDESAVQRIDGTVGVGIAFAG